jgi:uncharacterized protein (TIGR03084 family)
MDVREIVEDLAAEHEALDAVVAGLEPAGWATPTPSPRWSVADQIGHLAYFDRTAAIAIAEPERFSDLFDELWGAAVGGDPSVDELTLGWARSLQPEELLAEWRTRRARLIDVARNLPDDTRVPWYGPSMGARSFVTARLMETWAHGQDIVDAVGAHRTPSDRLEHIARLGVITRGWTYANRGEEAPDVSIRVELRTPSGGLATWGPDDAEEVVSGPLEDFCLVVTQRRHPRDTALEASGPAATDWLVKSQVFAGPATDGPPASDG